MTEPTKHQIKRWTGKLELAQEHLREAVEILDEYCTEADNREARDEILDQLRILIDDTHGFLTNRTNIERIIDEMDEDCK